MLSQSAISITHECACLRTGAGEKVSMISNYINRQAVKDGATFTIIAIAGIMIGLSLVISIVGLP